MNYKLFIKIGFIKPSFTILYPEGVRNSRKLFKKLTLL